MIISKTSISKLNPCKNRFDNFVEHYKDKEFTPRQFMGLKSITQDDKMWVSFRMMSTENAVKAAADIAESVLSIYEAAYPGDHRPRNAITAARSGDRDASASAAAAAAAAAASAAAAAASASAAAPYAAAAAYAASAAAAAADYAAAASAANAASAASAADYAAASAYAAAASANAGDARKVQEKRIRTIVLKYLK